MHRKLCSLRMRICVTVSEPAQIQSVFLDALSPVIPVSG